MWDRVTKRPLDDRAPKCLTQQLCMLMFRAYRCYIAGIYEEFGDFKLLPRERPTATRRLARNAFQGSLLSRLSIFGGPSR